MVFSFFIHHEGHEVIEGLIKYQWFFQCSQCVLCETHFFARNSQRPLRFYSSLAVNSKNPISFFFIAFMSFMVFIYFYHEGHEFNEGML